MKDQYFADKRDFFKWDFLEDILDGCAELKYFTNITMLTRPDDSREGNFKVYEASDGRKQLYDFLQRCLADGKQRVSEMQTYFQRKRFGYYAYRDSAQAPYTYESREDYFCSIPEDKLQQALVFFDPDIGLNAGRMNYMRRSGISKYLFDKSLSAVARRVSDDSVIVVYQHLQRDRNRFWDDVEERCGRFRDCIRAKGAAFLTDRDVVFLATSRDANVRLKMSNIVVTYAHKHGLDSGELAA
jgi:hypothetical protein